MTIARRKSITKNKKSGRKIRVLLKRRGSRKAHLKGGAFSAAAAAPSEYTEEQVVQALLDLATKHVTEYTESQTQSFELSQPNSGEPQTPLQLEIHESQSNNESVSGVLCSQEESFLNLVVNRLHTFSEGVINICNDKVLGLGDAAVCTARCALQKSANATSYVAETIHNLSATQIVRFLFRCGMNYTLIMSIIEIFIPLLLEDYSFTDTLMLIITQFMEFTGNQLMRAAELTYTYSNSAFYSAVFFKAFYNRFNVTARLKAGEIGESFASPVENIYEQIKTQIDQKIFEAKRNGKLLALRQEILGAYSREGFNFSELSEPAAVLLTEAINGIPENIETPEAAAQSVVDYIIDQTNSGNVNIIVVVLYYIKNAYTQVNEAYQGTIDTLSQGIVDVIRTVHEKGRRDRPSLPDSQDSNNDPRQRYSNKYSHERRRNHRNPYKGGYGTRPPPTPSGGARKTRKNLRRKSRKSNKNKKKNSKKRNTRK